MEILAVFVIVITLCVILNISTLRILIGLLAITALIVTGMILLFVYYFLCLLQTTQKFAKFLRIDSSDRFPFQVAYYLVDDEEYPCVFPAEAVLRNKLYLKDKPYRILLNRHIGGVFDRYAATTCILGTLLSIGAVFVMVLLVQQILE